MRRGADQPLRRSAQHATCEAYRAYLRRVHQAAQPFLTLALVLGVLQPAAAPLEFRLLHPHWPASPWLALALYAAPMLVGLVFLGLAVMKTLRFRREHPIPEEWRLIPRIRIPPVPRRKPPLG